MEYLVDYSPQYDDADMLYELPGSAYQSGVAPDRYEEASRWIQDMVPVATPDSPHLSFFVDKSECRELAFGNISTTNIWNKPCYNPEIDWHKYLKQNAAPAIVEGWSWSTVRPLEVVTAVATAQPNPHAAPHPPQIPLPSIDEDLDADADVSIPTPKAASMAYSDASSLDALRLYLDTVAAPAPESPATSGGSALSTPTSVRAPLSPASAASPLEGVEDEVDEDEEDRPRTIAPSLWRAEEDAPLTFVPWLWRVDEGDWPRHGETGHDTQHCGWGVCEWPFSDDDADASGGEEDTEMMEVRTAVVEPELHVEMAHAPVELVTQDFDADEDDGEDEEEYLPSSKSRRSDAPRERKRQRATTSRSPHSPQESGPSSRKGRPQPRTDDDDDDFDVSSVYESPESSSPASKKRKRGSPRSSPRSPTTSPKNREPPVPYTPECLIGEYGLTVAELYASPTGTHAPGSINGVDFRTPHVLPGFNSGDTNQRNKRAVLTYLQIPDAFFVRLAHPSQDRRDRRNWLFQCKLCVDTIAWDRRPDIYRHVETHVPPKARLLLSVCAGKQAGVDGAGRQLWVGGCGKLYSRGDALHRHVTGEKTKPSCEGGFDGATVWDCEKGSVEVAGPQAPVRESPAVLSTKSIPELPRSRSKKTAAASKNKKPKTDLTRSGRRPPSSP